MPGVSGPAKSSVVRQSVVGDEAWWGMRRGGAGGGGNESPKQVAPFRPSEDSGVYAGEVGAS